MIYKRFYSELGKLLYAVADVDRMITETEKKKLYDIVRKELAPLEAHRDEFGTDVAFYSEIEFDFLDEQIIDTQTAFNSFIDFVEEHHTAFDQRLKNICLRVTKELAAVYHGTNKKEKALIRELEKKLNRIENMNT